MISHFMLDDSGASEDCVKPQGSKVSHLPWDIESSQFDDCRTLFLYVSSGELVTGVWSGFFMIPGRRESGALQHRHAIRAMLVGDTARLYLAYEITPAKSFPAPFETVAQSS